MSLLDSLVKTTSGLADVYAKVKATDAGVGVTPARTETNSAAAPLVQQGSPADVRVAAVNAQPTGTNYTPIIIGVVLAVVAAVVLKKLL